MSRQNNKFLTTQDMVLIAVFTALIVVCSWISINVGPVPFTLQTFGIFVTAGMLGTKRGTLSVIIYILLGLAGVPVFSGFSAGPAVIAGPTGGYILGFIGTAIIIGLVMKLFKASRTWFNVIMTGIAMIVGDALCFVIGTIYFMFVVKVTMVYALSVCVIPYIIPDLIKMVIAVIIVNRVKKHVEVFK